MQAVLCWAVTKFGWILDQAGLWLTDAQAADAVDYGVLFVQTFMWLARDALENARPRYKLRPKMHSFFCEVLMRMHHGGRTNARWVACFSEEDYIGKICGMIRKAVHGSTFGRRSLERALLGVNTHLMCLAAKTAA